MWLSLLDEYRMTGTHCGLQKSGHDVFDAKRKFKQNANITVKSFNFLSIFGILRVRKV